MNYTWDWSVLFKAPYNGWLLSGLWLTAALSMVGWFLALPVGMAVGIGRVSTNRLISRLALLYISVFRNIPLLLQMFVWFFVFPEVLPNSAGLWFKRDLPNPEFWTAVIALTFYTSGRLSELFRAGIDAVPKGQSMAAAACGMNSAQALRHVVIPQALRIISPPLTSEFLSIVKNSSLALTIGVLEITAQSREIENFTFHGFEAFGAATLFYVLVALMLNTVSIHLQRRFTRDAARSTEHA
jgi:glutamate/aspartate transport system permease protein